MKEREHECRHKYERLEPLSRGSTLLYFSMILTNLRRQKVAQSDWKTFRSCNHTREGSQSVRPAEKRLLCLLMIAWPFLIYLLVDFQGSTLEWGK